MVCLFDRFQMLDYHLVAMKYVPTNVKSFSPPHSQIWRSHMKATVIPRKDVCAVPGLWDSCLKKGGARKSDAADYGVKGRQRTGDMTCRGKLWWNEMHLQTLQKAIHPTSIPGFQRNFHLSSKRDNPWPSLWTCSLIYHCIFFFFLLQSRSSY